MPRGILSSFGDCTPQTPFSFTSSVHYRLDLQLYVLLATKRLVDRVLLLYPTVKIAELTTFTSNEVARALPQSKNMEEPTTELQTTLNIAAAPYTEGFSQ